MQPNHPSSAGPTHILTRHNLYISKPYVKYNKYIKESLATGWYVLISNFSLVQQIIQLIDSFITCHHVILTLNRIRDRILKINTPKIRLLLAFYILIILNQECDSTQFRRVSAKRRSRGRLTLGSLPQNLPIQ